MEASPTSKAAPEKSTPQGSAEPDQPENLTRELILSLSKEIETTMTSIMAFRTRVGFGMFVGPFLLLGSFIVGAKGQPVSFNLSLSGKIAIFVDLVCFLAIAFIAAKIEDQAFYQCNKWRKLMWAISKTPSAEVKPTDLEVRARPYMGYLASFSLLFISVVAAVFIIKNAGTVESSKSAETGTTFRIVQISPPER